VVPDVAAVPDEADEPVAPLAVQAYRPELEAEVAVDEPLDDEVEPPYALAETAVQCCCTQVCTWLLAELPPPGPPPPIAPPSITYFSCPEATSCWSLAAVIAGSLPVNPNIEITARPVCSSIEAAEFEFATATSHFAEP